LESQKSLTDLLNENFVDAMDQYRESVPNLIMHDKPMHALQLASELDKQILDVHQLLTKVYYLVYSRFELLERHDAVAIKIFKEMSIIGWLRPRLHATYGMYLEANSSLPEGVTQKGLMKSALQILGREYYEDSAMVDSQIDKLIFVEIQYFIYILRNVVEPDWFIGDLETSNNDEKPDRYIPKSVKLEVWRRDQGKCVECGSKEKLEYDHVISVSKGGSNTSRNVQLLCETCNRKKSANVV
jgi:hypothetical protein